MKSSGIASARRAGHRRYPPGPSSILPSKLLNQFMRDPVATLMDIANEYGEIAHFKFGRRHIYLVNSPEQIENILIRDYRNFIKSRGLQVSRRLLGEGLVTSEGEYHDGQRRIIQPAFHPNRVRGYGNLMAGYAERMSDSWQDGMTLDIHREMMHVTSAIIAKSMLGSDIAGAESDSVNNALLNSMEYLNRVLMPLGEVMGRIPMLPMNKKFQAAKGTLDSIVYEMIRQHRAGAGQDGQGYDLLHELIAAQDPEAGIGRMSDAQLRDEVMTIFLAGHETTANALTWTFYLLSQNPEAEQKLYDELVSVLGSAPRLPTVEDIAKLEYTEKVFRESMRLYPPAWTLGREALADYTTIDSYVIPKGSIVLMSQYVMHRNPRYYANPEKFDPDRWTREFKSSLPRFSYFPFGGGIRGCVGEPFAWIEGILVLATICRRWKMEHDPTHVVELKPLITLRPKYGMRMKLAKRNPRAG